MLGIASGQALNPLRRGVAARRSPVWVATVTRTAACTLNGWKALMRFSKQLGHMEVRMRFSKQLGHIVTFVVVALVMYLIGGAFLAVWPMWNMMWGMMGFGSGWLLALAALLIGLGVVWSVMRNESVE